MNRLVPKTGTRNRWVRFLAPGVVAVGLLAGVSFYLTRGAPPSGPAASSGPAGGHAAGSSGPPASCRAGDGVSCGSQSDIAIAASPVVVTIAPHKAAGSAHHAKSVPSASASPSASGSAPGTSPSAQPAGSAAGTAAARPTASASASQTASQDSAAAAQVLSLINRARASAGLPALTILSGLETSSSAHNMTMAGGCGLSHQCPGEPALGDRETAAGVHWTAAGENIGEGGPVAGTPAAIAQMAVGLTQSMLDEKPPDDGHRQNILSSTFTHIGIAVYRDGSGTVWLTQDFSN